MNFLLLMVFAFSIGAAFFVIFFSVPQAQAKQQVTGVERARVAIIIDDMGYSRKLGMAFINLPYDLSFSFLPSAPFSEYLQKAGYIAGKTIMLHVPLEPLNQMQSMEEDTLLLEMEEKQQRELFNSMTDSVPLAVGMNNHMGSRYTADKAAMSHLLAMAKARDLFFVDSLTTNKSVGAVTAVELGVAYVKRDVFLDNVKNEQAICGQLDKLVRIARKNGSAVGIGHPYPETLRGLQRCLRDSLGSVHVVSVEQFVKK